MPEQPRHMEISTAIQQCDFFIACLSKYSLHNQGYLQKEFRIALDLYGGKPLKNNHFLGLKFDDCDAPAIQLPQTGINPQEIQWVDYWQPDGLLRLLNVIGSKKKKGSGWIRRIKTNSLEMTFVYIPPGDFMMGSPASHKERDEDENRHKVTLTQGFNMQTTPVTQKQWKKVMGNLPSHFKRYRKDLPVESVSWDEVQQFIEILNQYGDGFHYRLPTEAEWEYAARAGSYARFCFGDSYEKLKDYAWFYDNSRVSTHPVAQKKSNQWGLYDMHGNVWEWCQDCYGPYKESDIIDPRGYSASPTRVIRGGSWSSLAEFCRSASRQGFVPSSRNDGLGFRLVKVNS